MEATAEQLQTLSDSPRQWQLWPTVNTNVTVIIQQDNTLQNIYNDFESKVSDFWNAVQATITGTATYTYEQLKSMQTAAGTQYNNLITSIQSNYDQVATGVDTIEFRKRPHTSLWSKPWFQVGALVVVILALNKHKSA